MKAMVATQYGSPGEAGRTIDERRMDQTRRVARCLTAMAGRSSLLRRRMHAPAYASTDMPPYVAQFGRGDVKSRVGASGLLVKVLVREEQPTTRNLYNLHQRNSLGRVWQGPPVSMRLNTRMVHATASGGEHTTAVLERATCRPRGRDPLEKSLMSLERPSRTLISLSSKDPVEQALCGSDCHWSLE